VVDRRAAHGVHDRSVTGVWTSAGHVRACFSFNRRHQNDDDVYDIWHDGNGKQDNTQLATRCLV